MGKKPGRISLCQYCPSWYSMPTLISPPGWSRKGPGEPPLTKLWSCHCQPRQPKHFLQHFVQIDFHKVPMISTFFPWRHLKTRLFAILAKQKKYLLAHPPKLAKTASWFVTPNYILKSWFGRHKCPINLQMQNRKCEQIGNAQILRFYVNIFYKYLHFTYLHTYLHLFIIIFL